MQDCEGKVEIDLMRTIFIGTVDFSRHMLKKLIDLKVDVVGVITKSHSAYNADYCDLSELAMQNEIPYMYIDNINDDKVINFFEVMKPDIIMCFGLSQIIGKKILDYPRMGVIGYHPALLPKNRGRHPIIWPIVLGMNKTGSTFFFMDEGADSGDIISQKEVVIEKDDEAIDLYNRLIMVAKEQVEEFVPMLLSSTYKRIKQNENESSYWRKRTKEDGIIDWRMSGESIRNLVRALANPYPGAEFVYGNVMVKVWKVNVIEDTGMENVEAGKIVGLTNEGKPVVKTGQGCIELVEYDLDVEFKKGDYL